MMKNLSVAVVLLTVGSATGVAQSSQCPSGLPLSVAQVTQDACQKAVDLFQYMAPQLGGAITGGNATLGQGGSLGGLGHFSVGVRVNVLAGSIPQINDASAQPVFTGARSTAFRTSDTPFPMPTADAAIGIFAGLPLGLTNVGGIDLLVSASYIPNVEQDNVSVDADTPLKLGYGVRLSALQESIVMPGVSLTYLRRDLPKLAMTGVAGLSTLNVDNFDEQTTAWRIVASKSLIVFGVAVGYGQDKYESSANASATASGVKSSPINVDQSITRSNLFADLSLNFPIFKLIVEGGQLFGGAAPATVNTFTGKGIVDSRLYASLGIRLGW